jgi:hypothetical protein
MLLGDLENTHSGELCCTIQCFLCDTQAQRASEYKQANAQDVWADRQRLTLCSDDTIKLCAVMDIAQAPVMEDAQILAHVQRVTSNRGFLRTEDGFLGIGNKEIKPRDQVWVLAGGTHPFVLRECPTSPGHHTLVCEAYVDGVMLPGEIKNPYASLRVRREKERGAYSHDGECS